MSSDPTTVKPTDGPPTIISTEQSPKEQKNIDLCKEYMSIAYSPSRNAGGSSVAHLCSEKAWFWAPSTFPGCETPMDYAESHAHVMRPYQGIEANGNHAKWSAAAIFEVEEGKIKSFTKDWDQKVMQIQLGWAPVKDSEDPRWNQTSLSYPEKSRMK
ncbi:hypothetical protein LTR09_004765 [Extremus antarcticus]|uniref:Uncharacterized protein n=1 Tax=Extremus antarcticus TaxID=702011 RepID=A0AAJ0DPV9_9PEZI|nr:hypothetical protein LTR09_004765 [Extremus antarcticus]